MKMFYNKEKESGFSIIEAIVYIAIFAMFSGAIMTFSFNINSARLRSQAMLEAKDQGADLMRTLTTAIKNASLINNPGTGFSSGVLSINTYDAQTTPTVFSEDGEALYITQGALSPIALTNNKVKIINLSFYNTSQTNTPGVIQIRFTITNTAEKTLPQEQYSIDFYGTASVR